MDVIRSRVALRERALLDVVDLAVRFCATHARAYAKLSLIVLAPAFAASCLVSWAAGWWIGWAATVVMTAFAGAPFVALGARLVFADEVSAREALRVAARATPGLVAVRAGQLLALGVSALMLGLPWLWAGGSTLFIVEVRLLEQHGRLGVALARARRIARARPGTVVLAVVLLAAAPVASAMVADVAGRELLGQVLEIQPPASMFVTGSSWLALGGWWAALPLISTARFLLYLDVRTRAEGWDIQTRFSAIAARAHRPAGHAPVMRATGGALLALALLVTPSRANAALDPSRANADVSRSVAERGYAFCRDPGEPLSYRARALCGHASQIPDCQGFAAACARADKASGEHPARGASDPSGAAASVLAILGAISRMAVWLLVAAVVLAVLFPIARGLARMRASERGDGNAGDRGPAPPQRHGAPALDEAAGIEESVLLARADDLARQGHGAPALELYLAAALRALHKRGAVRMSPDRTNGEYVRLCTDATAGPALVGIVRDVDHVKFGGQDASLDVVSRTARSAAAIVRALPVAILALALTGACGCGKGVRIRVPQPGDDPSGDELWTEVLRRQGMTVDRLGGSLASLPLADAAGQSAAIVVSTDRTEIDRETGEHLLAWVDAGGALVLAGDPVSWPADLRPRTLRFAPGRALAVPFGDETERAELASTRAMDGLPDSTAPVASFGDRLTYAALIPHGHGYVLGIASDELMTNAGLARGGNAAAMVAIFSSVARDELRVAQEDDGVSPPSSPLSALSRAGLGVGLVHALVASLVLFLAVGVRLARPRPALPPPCRAFAEHVEAVGALYARAGAAPHALAAYVRFAEERLRARMPRGATDVAAFMATQARLPADVCRRLWARAARAKGETVAPVGDELAVLEELSAIYASATAETP